MIPEMVQPSTGTTILFVAIVLGVVAALIVGVGRVAPNNEPATTTRAWTVRLAIGLVLGLIITAAMSASGVLAGGSGTPPRVMFFFALSNLTGVVLAFTALGTRLVRHAPIWALVGFQSFRLPLELVLHQWYAEGVLPVQMTFEGHNFDIVTGIFGLLAGLVLWKGSLSTRQQTLLVWAFNIVGFGLLLTVAVIAMLSSPVPFRQYMNDPPVLLAYHAPYSWILPFCVSAALFGHLVTFRWLLADRQS